MKVFRSDGVDFTSDCTTSPAPTTDEISCTLDGVPPSSYTVLTAVLDAEGSGWEDTIANGVYDVGEPIDASAERAASIRSPMKVTLKMNVDSTSKISSGSLPDPYVQMIGLPLGSCSKSDIGSTFMECSYVVGTEVDIRAFTGDTHRLISWRELNNKDVPGLDRDACQQTITMQRTDFEGYHVVADMAEPADGTVCP